LKQIFVIGSAFVFLAAVLVAVLFFSFKLEGKINMAEQDFNFLRKGDLVLRRGRSVESFAVCMFDINRDYSHIGIVIVENKVPYVIHIVPDSPYRVRKDLPSIFLSNENASHFKVLRSDFQPEILNKVEAVAVGFFKSQLTFDTKYDLSTDTELYCTELIIKAFENSNITFPDIKPQKIKLLIGAYDVIMPGSFLLNSHFTSVKTW
jgi:hypothetical protein